MTEQAAVLALDVGNSKTDLVLVGADGRLLGARRGPTASHQQVGVERAMARIAELVARAAADRGGAGGPPYARLLAACLAGLDLPSDARLLGRAFNAAGLAPSVLLRNDTYAALRAGTRRGWGVGVVVGSGINAVGVSPTGRVARFDALGDISGDWGGGSALGLAAHAAAVRARDGRGARTALERLVPAHFGLRSVAAVTRRLYDGRLRHADLADLAQVVFAASAAGDPVAQGIVDRLADEIGAFATAAIGRTGMTRRDVEVCLAGGLIRPRDPRLLAGVERRVCAVAPRAGLVVVDAPPVLGAALLGLDALAGVVVAPEVEARLRSALEADPFGR